MKKLSNNEAELKKKMLLKESFFCHSHENLRINDLSFNVYHIHMFSRLSF